MAKPIHIHYIAYISYQCTVFCKFYLIERKFAKKSCIVKTFVIKILKELVFVCQRVEVISEIITVCFQVLLSCNQEFRREGWTEKCSAVCFCLGSGLFGSYNSD